MEFFTAWLLFAFVQLVATMSPGPAFAMTVRSALVHGRLSGMYLALGFRLALP